MLVACKAVAVVIPCYRVKAHICRVISSIGPEVQNIYVVDDCCPDRSGDFVEQANTDPRVSIIRHQNNQGVGGAVISGYRQAIRDGASIIVKVDGDGQMDPGLIPAFVAPIINGEADYCKGNRFFDPESVKSMPKTRLLGNAVLSFITKLSSGYWDIFDPTNGYTAIHADVLDLIPYKKVSTRYFFETDMLFHLNTLRAVVVDIPMIAVYEDEVSHLKIRKIIPEFAGKHFRNFCKRIFFNYYLRDMSIASLEFPIGLLLTLFGLIYGAIKWFHSWQTGIANASGTVVLVSLTILMGVQFLMASLGHDISSLPQRPLHRRLRHALHRK